MDRAPTVRPRSIVILDRRPEYARMLASLAAEDHGDVPIGLFDNLDDAQGWVETAVSPVVVLVDGAANNGLVVERALQWRERLGIVVIAMFDERNDDDVERANVVDADATFAKPYRKEMWACSFGAFLRDVLPPDRITPPIEHPD